MSRGKIVAKSFIEREREVGGGNEVGRRAGRREGKRGEKEGGEVREEGPFNMSDTATKRSAPNKKAGYSGQTGGDNK